MKPRPTFRWVDGAPAVERRREARSGIEIRGDRAYSGVFAAGAMTMPARLQSASHRSSVIGQSSITSTMTSTSTMD